MTKAQVFGQLPALSFLHKKKPTDFFFKSRQGMLKPSWRNGNDSSGDEDDGYNVQIRVDDFNAQPGLNLDQVIRQDLCAACDKKFCTGCAINEQSRTKAVKPIEIVRFVKNFKLIRRSTTLIDVPSSLMSLKAPFLVSKRWPGSVVACALMASNKIPGDISCKNKPQKVSFLGS